MQLQEFMTRNPHAIQADDSCQHAAEQMRRHNIGALPVFAYDSLAGIITDRDIVTGCTAGGHSAQDCSVREHMTADPVTIRAEATVEECLAKMADEQVRRLLVTNGGQVSGIVSIGDLAVRCPASPDVARALAEISQPIRVPLMV